MKQEFADFLLTEEVKEVRDLIRDYSDRKIAPIATELDQKHQFPREQFEELGEALQLYLSWYVCSLGQSPDQQLLR